MGYGHQTENRLVRYRSERVVAYRDLIGMFVKRDFVTIYKQTILGPLWYIIQPLIHHCCFTIIFGRVAKIPPMVPPFLFYMAGNVMWGYFAASLTLLPVHLMANAGIFGKVYFPG
jgi:lipopolysaccharide transport system permease protein